MYAEDNADKMIYTSGKPPLQPNNDGGGFWPGPYNDKGQPRISPPA